MKMDTRNKIQLATAAYKVVSFARRCAGKDDHVEVKRGGVTWNLDLHEGIDFSIFLLGGFERGTLRLYTQLLGRERCEVVLDIGANIGAHTLPLAQLVVPKGGKVYAFEPTVYAYGKLLENIALNPSIGGGRGCTSHAGGRRRHCRRAGNLLELASRKRELSSCGPSGATQKHIKRTGVFARLFRSYARDHENRLHQVGCRWA